MKKRKMTPEQRRAYEEQKSRWAQTTKEVAEIFARREERLRAWAESIARRRARLHRLTLGLLGR